MLLLGVRRVADPDRARAGVPGQVVELGPGTTLSGLVKRCRDDVGVTAAGTPAEVDALLPALFGVGVAR